MDFEDILGHELQEFRSKVSAWLDDNTPPDAATLLQSPFCSAEVQNWARDFQRRLADRGWATPSWPREYGGGGLTRDHDTVVREELESRRIPLLYETNRRVGGSIMSWGAPQQKQRFLRPLVRGEAAAWWSLSLSAAVLDPGCAPLRAVRDGDVYLVSGEEVFQAGLEGQGYLWTLAVTDPEAQPQRRLSAFLIPTQLSGVTIDETETGPVDCQRRAKLDAAPVPAEYLVGGEGYGWLVVHSALDVEEYADRALKQQRIIVGQLVSHCKESLLGRASDRDYKHKRELAAEAYINSHVLRVLSLRNRWMRSTNQELTFHGPQRFLLAKEMNDRLSSAALDVLGPFSLTTDSEWAPANGEAERLQRGETPGAEDMFAADAQEQSMRLWLSLQAEKQGDWPPNAS